MLVLPRDVHVQSLGTKYEKALPPLVDFGILGTTKSPSLVSCLYVGINT